MVRQIFMGLVMMTMGMAAEADEFGDTFGDGVAAYSLQKYERSREIWLPLARGGMADAQYRLAELFERGLGGAQDASEAAMWYARATEQGHLNASVMYAGLLAEGRGVAKDTEKSLVLYEGAARSGHSGAAFHMGTLYLQGGRLEKDAATAYAWFSCAVRGQGMPGDIARAKAMVTRLDAALRDDTKAKADAMTFCEQ